MDDPYRHSVQVLFLETIFSAVHSAVFDWWFYLTRSSQKIRSTVLKIMASLLSSLCCI